MIRMFAALLSSLVFALPADVQGRHEAPPPPPPPTPRPEPTFNVAGNKVDGLELPADMSVSYDEGYVSLQAKCTGAVKWLVLGNAKTKITSVGDIVIVAVPPQDGAIVSVYAVGWVSGKFTDWAKTNITVRGPPAPEPMAKPGPAEGHAPSVVLPSGSKVHVTIVLDKSTADNKVTALLRSAALRKSLTSAGVALRSYDIKDKIVDDRQLRNFLSNDGSPTMLVQVETAVNERNEPVPAGAPGARVVGVVRYSGPLPPDEAAIVETIQRVVKDK